MKPRNERSGSCVLSQQEIIDLEWNGKLPLTTAVLNMLAKKGAPIFGCCNPHLSTEYSWFSHTDRVTHEITISWKYNQ